MYVGKHYSPPHSRVQTKFHRLSSSDGQKGPRRVLTVHTQATQCFHCTLKVRISGAIISLNMKQTRVCFRSAV